MKFGIMILKEEENVYEVARQLKECGIQDITYFPTNTLANVPTKRGKRSFTIGSIHQILHEQEEASATLFFLMKDQQVGQVETLLKHWNESDYTFFLVPMESIQGSFIA